MDPRLREAVDRIVAAADPEAVILFGSQARGEADAESDWDVFVLLPDDVPPGRFTPVTLGAVVDGLGIPIDVIPCTRSDYETRRQRKATLSHAVARDGIALYRRG